MVAWNEEQTKGSLWLLLTEHAWHNEKWLLQVFIFDWLSTWRTVLIEACASLECQVDREQRKACCGMDKLEIGVMANK